MLKALFMVLLVIVLIGGGLKLAGVPLPFLDYAVGPLGEGHGPVMPDVQIEPPGFHAFDR